jgi:hypothetical protein
MKDQLNQNIENPDKLEKTIADYLTVYAVWSAIVVFVLPWILYL